MTIIHVLLNPGEISLLLHNEKHLLSFISPWPLKSTFWQDSILADMSLHCSCCFKPSPICFATVIYSTKCCGEWSSFSPQVTKLILGLPTLTHKKNKEVKSSALQ